MAKSMRPEGRVRTTLLLLNGVGALIAAGFAAAGLARPSIAEPRSDAEPNTLIEFWSASSAIRTWAITGPLLAALLTRGGPSPQLVTAAGIVQVGDAVLGLRQRNTGMTIAPAVMGVIHLTT
ncbi:MAG: hypothetical protein ACR2LF_06590, partial [Jatrophihabitantaceae bacterium]